jgi:hypothetical protein
MPGQATCEQRNKGQKAKVKNKKIRNEEARATGLKTYLINMNLTHPKISAVPVRPLHSSKFTDCMPTGRFICPISPARKEKKLIK